MMLSGAVGGLRGEGVGGDGEWLWMRTWMWMAGYQKGQRWAEPNQWRDAASERHRHTDTQTQGQQHHHFRCPR